MFVTYYRERCLSRNARHKQGLCHRAVSICLSICLSRSCMLFKRINITSLLYDAMHSAAIAVTRCLSVCLSVTFVSCAQTNKDIFECFSPSGSQAILVFPYQTGCRYSDGNPPNGGVECKSVWKNWRFSTNISLYLRNGYSQMGTCSETICKHRIRFPSIQHLAWLPQGRPQGKQKCG